MKAPMPVVRLIVEDDQNRVLVLRRQGSSYGNGRWCLPGGKVDFGETVLDAAAKELREETSLKCVQASFLFYQDSLPYDGSDLHCINFFFVVETEGEIELNPESEAFAWITANELSEYSLAFRNDEGLERYWSEKSC